MPLPTKGPFPSYVPTALKETEASGDLTMTASGQMVGTRVYECPYYEPGPPATTYLDYMRWLLGRSYQDADGKVHVVPPDVFSNELNFLVCQEISVRHKGIVGYEAAPDFPGGIKDPGGPRTLAAGDNDPPNPFTDLPPGNPNPKAGPFVWAPDYLQKPIQFSQRVVFLTSVLTCKYSALTHDEEVKLHVRSQERKGIGYAWSKSVTDEVVQTDAIAGQDLLAVVASGDFSFSKRHVLAPAFFSVMKLLGKVNSLEFLKYPLYTVLFAGCDGKRSHLADGTPVWDMHLKFLIDPNQHCRKFRPGPGGGFLQYQKNLYPQQIHFVVGVDFAGGFQPGPTTVTSIAHGLSAGAVLKFGLVNDAGEYTFSTVTVQNPVTENTFDIPGIFWAANYTGQGYYTRLDDFANLPADLTPLLAYR